MKSASTRIILASVLLVAAAGAAACDEKRPPGSGDSTSYGSAGGTSGSSGASSGTTASSSTSGTVSQRGPETCEGALQLAEEIPEIRKTSATPQPLGGVIEPGIYVLSEVYSYEGGPPPSGEDEPAPNIAHTGVKTKKTLYVAGNLMRVVGARSAPSAALPPDTTEAWTFGPNGLNLDTKTVCPQSGTLKSMPYSAVGPALSLFVDASHREVYMKR